jgi:phosphoglucosamine mutase
VKQEKLFGTDGVRGIANVYPMTVEISMFIGQAVAAVLKAHASRQRILIGKDTRLSGYMLENALVAGICSMGGDALLVGPLPTPAVAFLTRNMRADAGIVISASHNPYEDNGIKIFGADGYKLSDVLEEELESYVRSLHAGSRDAPRPTADSVGRARRIDDALGRYIVALKYTFPQNLSLDGFKLAVDCAHGATYKVAPAVLGELGASLALLGVEPNGTNINAQAGSLHPAGLQQMVREGRASLGLAFDGDGDRLILVDEKAEVVDGDQVLALCAKAMQERGLLRQSTVVATVMSNLGLELCLRELNIQLLRTNVGDRYVVEAMRGQGYNLGGEQSGHIIFLDHNTTGDGLLSALQVLAIMAESGRSLYELKKILTPIPQILKNIRVKQKADLAKEAQWSKTFKQVESRLGSRGRVLVRYSGTEPVLRIMVESEDARLTESAVEELAAAAYRVLGRGE